MKKLNVAIQMDPLEKLDLTGDSTFVSGLEAQKRKHILYHFTPDNLFYKDKKVFANMKELKLSVNSGKEKYTYGKNKTQELAKFDIILITVTDDIFPILAIEEMMKSITEEDYDFVSGTRYALGGKK